MSARRLAAARVCWRGLAGSQVCWRARLEVRWPGGALTCSSWPNGARGFSRALAWVRARMLASWRVGPSRAGLLPRPVLPRTLAFALARWREGLPARSFAVELACWRARLLARWLASAPACCALACSRANSPNSRLLSALSGAEGRSAGAAAISPVDLLPGNRTPFTQSRLAPEGGGGGGGNGTFPSKMPTGPCTGWARQICVFG